jgi:hypothetical protein
VLSTIHEVTSRIFVIAIFPCMINLWQERDLAMKVFTKTMWNKLQPSKCKKEKRHLVENFRTKRKIPTWLTNDYFLLRFFMNLLVSVLFTSHLHFYCKIWYTSNIYKFSHAPPPPLLLTRMIEHIYDTHFESPTPSHTSYL